MSDTYCGGELELFSKATNWKAYYASRLLPFVYGRVLEVGAGLGGTTPFFCNPHVKEWVSLEPDAELCGQIPTDCAPEQAAVNGTLADMDAASMFDAILYIDVLEHIEDDGGELRQAAAHLPTGGKIVVMSPAHNFLFSPFDKQVGHFRRYSVQELVDICPLDCKIAARGYLDSAGFFLSLGNRCILSSSMPTEGQIHFWDKRIIPVSRVLDKLLGYRFGKSAYVVYEKI